MKTTAFTLIRYGLALILVFFLLRSNAKNGTNPSKLSISKPMVKEGSSLKDKLKSLGIFADAKDSISCDNYHHVLKLYGHAFFKTKKINVKADYIEYSLTKKTGFASGNIIINSRKYSATEKTF